MLGPKQFVMLVGSIAFVALFALGWTPLLLVAIYCWALPWPVVLAALPLGLLTYVVYLWLFDRGIVRWPVE